MQNTIAVIFDFDDTLAPDSTSTFLESYGIDTPSFWSEKVDALRENGWDPIPAYLYMMIQESKARGTGEGITRELLQACGESLALHPGATRIFGELRKYADEQYPDIVLEFYLISSGIYDIVSSSRIAKNFTDIWACDFHYNEHGEIEFPKNVVSFTDKTRYLFHISKGIIGPEMKNQPFEVNRWVPKDKIRIPFENMIFVGDGYTDIPCFSLVRHEGGKAIGVYDPENREKWGRAWGFVEENRVTNLSPADYTKKSGLNHSLHMAIDSVARNIELKSKTYQG